MTHYYRNVPGLGNVVLSRHAQERAADLRITDAEVEHALFHGLEMPDGQTTIWKNGPNVRLVIIIPTPNRGARLCTTMFRIQAQAKSK